MISSLRCKYAAETKNNEHIANMAVRGNKATLYKIIQTKRLSGILKQFITVLLISSGTYVARIFIMLGQKIPTKHSKTRNPSIVICPSSVIDCPGV